MNTKTTIGQVLQDAERYLAHDCYYLGKIYSPDGFFCMIFKNTDECVVIEQSEDMTAVIATTSMQEKLEHPQAIIFWHDEGDSKIVAAQRIDATDNNIELLRSIVKGEKTDRTIDEFVEGSTQRVLSQILGMCDAVMIS